MRKFWLFILLCVFLIAGYADARMVVYPISGEVCDNFNNYTETDPGSDITITADKVTWTDLETRDDTALVYHNKGSGYYDGDFTVRFKMYVSECTWNGCRVYVWHVDKTGEDIRTHDSGNAENDDAFALNWSFGTSHEIWAEIWEDGVEVQDDGWSSPSLSTVYYITVTRVHNGGTNSTGRYTVYICTTDYCTSGGNLQDTLGGANGNLDSSVGEQNDFDYVVVSSTYDTNSGAGFTSDGYIECLEIGP